MLETEMAEDAFIVLIDEFCIASQDRFLALQK
jgi:hypothetical protein